MPSKNLTPVEFAKLFFGWVAFDYQKDPLNDLYRRVLMACGRQVGKLRHMVNMRETL
jgi:hypothetical protein